MLLETLFANLSAGTACEIRAFRREDNGKNPPRRSFYRNPAQAQRAAEAFAQQGLEVYFGVAVRNGHGGTKEHVTETRAVWADYDRKDDIGTILQGFPLPPSFVVDSGTGYHIYWLLDQPQRDQAHIERALQHIQRNIASDPSAAEVARVLRVPNTYNYKHTPPTNVTLWEAKPNYFYTLDDFFRISNLDPLLGHVITTGHLPSAKSRSERDWQVISELVKNGLSDGAITAIFDYWPIGDKARESNGEKYLEHTVKKARSQIREHVILPQPGAEHEDQTVRETPAGILRLYEAARLAFAEQGIYYLTKEGNPVLLAPWSLTVKALHESPNGEDTFILDIHTGGYTWHNVPFPVSVFNSGAALRKHMPRAAWSWPGSDAQTVHLRWAIMLEWRAIGQPKALVTERIGRYITPEHDVMVTEEEVFDKQGNQVSDIVYARPNRERPVIHLPNPQGDDISRLAKIAYTLPRVNDPATILPVLGWWLATSFKPALEQRGERFPHLIIHGPRGSGKTTTITRILQPLIGYRETTSYLSNTTPFALLNLLGATSSIPICLAEHRASTQTHQAKFLQLLRIAYDAGRDSRGKADQTTQEYELTSPICIDGEDPINDPAVLERCVAVAMSAETIRNPRYKRILREAEELPLPLWGRPFMLHCMGQDVLSLYDTARDLFDAAYPETIPDRPRHNYTIALMGLIAYRDFCVQALRISAPIELSTAAVRLWLTPSLAEVVDLRRGRTSLLVDEFIASVINEIAQTRNAPQPAFPYRIGDTGIQVGFHLQSAFDWWLSKRHRERQQVMELRALRGQLGERQAEDPTQPTNGMYYLGYTNTHVTNVGTMQLYWVDLQQARASHLDVPENLLAPQQARFDHNNKIIRLTRQG